MPIPAELDYDLWLGPAPEKPYNPHRVHQTFRGYWDYDAGGLGDMGQHYIDPVQYILGKDDTSPVKVEVDAPQQHPDAVGTWRSITYTYADGCQIVLWGGDYGNPNTPYIAGPKGNVYKNFVCDIPDWEKKLADYPDPAPQVTDFMESVRTRKPFALNEISVSRVSPSMLGVDVEVDGAQLPTYWADGLLVATSSGSTAYSLSVGGPICLPETKVFIVAPISPHNLNVRPLIVPEGSRICISLRSRDDRAVLSMDNRNYTVPAGTRIEVGAAPMRLRLLRLGQSNFINALRTRLLWGEDVRNGGNLE